MHETLSSSTGSALVLGVMYCNASTLYRWFTSHLSYNQQRYSESSWESIIVIKGVILLNDNSDCLVIKVYPNMIFRYPLGLYFAFRLCLNIFFKKCTPQSLSLWERRGSTYLIWNLHWNKEVAIVSMFSHNVQYQIKKPFKVMLITNEEKWLLEGEFMGRELNTSVGRKLITTLQDANDSIIKTDKLACVMETVLSLDKFDNTDNQENGKTQQHPT